MRKRFLQLIGGLTVCAFVVGCGRERDGDAPEYPTQPIEVVVPFEPGGGTDTFTRILANAIAEQHLLPQPMVIRNVPGAGATIGSRTVKDAKPDGYTLLVLHDALITAKHSQSNPIEYGPESFEVIAGTGDVGLIVAVAEDSKYTSLSQLMEAAKAKPDEIPFSANIGAPVHFAGLMLENASPGSRFRYVQDGGGTERFAALKGGHADVSVFSVAEYLQFRKDGLRALAYCAAERHPHLDVPTAREQGYDVLCRNMHFWWAPKGTPERRLAVIREALRRVMASREVREHLARLEIEPSFVVGKALREELADRERRIAAVSQRPTQELPDFPRMAIAMVVVLGMIVGVQEIGARRTVSSDVPGRADTPPSTDESSAVRVSPRTAVVVTSALTVGYVAAMQFDVAGFRVATAAFVACVGLVLAGRNRGLQLLVLALAGILGIGLYAVLTGVFKVVLP